MANNTIKHAQEADIMAKKNVNVKTSMVKALADNSVAIERMGKMSEGLANLNTMRGGEKGF